MAGFRRSKYRTITDSVQLILAPPCQSSIKVLQPLAGYVQVTSSVDEPDMITFDDSTDRSRARMPCGHVISPESMVDYCSDTLSNGKFTFTCPDPKCDVEWDYFIVRHVASVSATASQLEEFDTLVSENYLQRNSKMLQCPGCMTWCFKDDASNCVDCPICRQKYGLGSRFCWCCLGRWRGESRGNFCGNVNCDGVDRRIIILAVCPDRLIIGRWCPAIRGCPKCGLLIEYLECCTQMNCRGCKHYFCFFCLEGANSKLELTCNPWISQCQIAARQTALPGL